MQNGPRKLARADQEDRAREIVRPMVAAGARINYNELGKLHGIAHVTIEKAARLETVLMHETTNIDGLSQTAQEKLTIARRMLERKLKAEHAARMRNLDEEVRQRVLSDGKAYLDRLNAMEQQARDTVERYKARINDHKPLFTLDQFRTILMCLHPDGQRTPEKLSEAFRLFNTMKLQLTGEK